MGVASPLSYSYQFGECELRARGGSYEKAQMHMLWESPDAYVQSHLAFARC